MLKKIKIKLTTRLILSVLGAVFIMNVLLLISIGISSSNKAEEAGLNLAISKSQEAAAQVKNLIDEPTQATNYLAELLQSSIEEKSQNRNGLVNLFRRLVKNTENFYCVWVGMEPNSYDNKDENFRNNPKYQKIKGAFCATSYKNHGAVSDEIPASDWFQGVWYVEPLKNKRLTIAEPYTYSYTGEVSDSVYITTLSYPLFTNGKPLGVIGIDISLASLRTICKSATLYETGFATIITDKLTFASHPNNKKIGKNLSVETTKNLSEIRTAISEGKTYSFQDVSNESGKEVLRCFTPIPIAGTGQTWAVMVEIPMNEITATSRALMSFILLIGILGMIAMAVMIFFIAKSIISPIQKGIGFAEEIANGNLNATLNIEERDDEIGDLKNALQFMSEKLKGIVTDVIENSLNIVSASKLLNSTSMDLSSGANEQAAANEEVAANMEQMVANINQNGDNSSQTEQIAVQASKDIEEASFAVISTVEAMNKIAERITIIGEIAEKTDLLAINAAIEAARAGEQGKGFAVVANEIRKLAERSQAAANQIEELTRSSVKIADKSGDALTKIVPNIKKTAMLVQEISISSIEQNTGASQINAAIMQLNIVTQRNASVAEEMASASEELFAQAEQLKETISYYQIDEIKKGSSSGKATEKLASKLKTATANVFSMKPSGKPNTEIKLGEQEKDSDYDRF